LARPAKRKALIARMKSDLRAGWMEESGSTW
jgi:hypothetical protein